MVVTAAASLLLCAAYGTPAFADIIHDYELNGNYNDANGGPPALPGGGDLTTNPGFYTFTVNQGLTLDKSLISGGTYDIKLAVDFTAAGSNGWTKIADFTALTPDVGWYVNDSNQETFCVTSGSQVNCSNKGGSVTFSQMNTFELTRDATKVMSGYLNTVQVFSLTDSSNEFVLGAQNIVFFQDDHDSGFKEGGSGMADYIRTSFPASTVPEPSGILLLGTAVVGIVASRVRWKMCR